MTRATTGGEEEAQPSMRRDASALIAALQDGLVVRAPDGAIVEVNERFCEMTGFDAGELVGLHPPFPFWPPGEDGLDAGDVLRRGYRGELDTDLRRKDGSPLRATLAASELHDQSGSVAGSVMTLKDITERGRAELAIRRSEERHRSMIETAVDAIIAIDADGTIDSVNPAVERIFGYRRDELLGQDVRLLMPEPDRSRHDGYIARYLASGEPRIVGGRREVVARRKDGSTFPVHLSVGEMDVGGRRMFTGIVSDISERVRLESELRFALAEQAALSRVATSVATGAHPHVTLGLAAREVADLLGVEVAFVFRFEAAHARVICAWGADVPPVDAKATLTDGLLSRVRRTGRASRDDDLQAPWAPDAGDDALLTPCYRAAVASPIHIGTEVWGAIVAATTRSERITPLAEARLAHVAEVAGVAIASAEARAQLTSLAASDPLTRAANHRTFHEALRDEFERARRHGRDLSLVIVDLDLFKHVNDVHGHQVGDAVLVEAARRLESSVRAGELVARIGGEEFAVILPDASADGAFVAAERARATIASESIPPVGRVTVSAGICSMTEADDAMELFRLADEALYWAKVHGRDRTFRYAKDIVVELSAAERADRVARSQALAGLRALARVIDAKDPSTQRHSERVADLSARLARVRGWPPERIAQLEEAALLHDVGKTAIADAVLFKPGPLSAEQYEHVKVHAPLGALIASEVLTEEQVAWIRHHHERHDGGGYPDGLSASEIPDGARILAVGDAWDVMTVARHYKLPMSPHDALDEFRRTAGRQFDPETVQALEALWAEGFLRSYPGAEQVPDPGRVSS